MMLARNHLDFSRILCTKRRIARPKSVWRYQLSLLRLAKAGRRESAIEGSLRWKVGVEIAKGKRSWKTRAKC